MFVFVLVIKYSHSIADLLVGYGKTALLAAYLCAEANVIWKY